MKTSKDGIHLVHQFEGKRNKPYLCPASIWTVGFGSVLYQDQIKLPLVRKDGYTGLIRAEYKLRTEHDREWSNEEVDELFSRDLVSFERGVLRLAPNLDSPEHQHKFDACVAFSFNVGLGNFQRSSIRQCIKREDWDGAAEAFMQWTKAGGKVLKGLVRRRDAERQLFAR